MSLAAATASASDWLEIAKDDGGNRYSLDRQSVIRDRDTVTSVVRNEYATPRIDVAKGKSFYAALDRLVVNCETASFALQTRTLVASDGSEVVSLAATRDQLKLRSAAPGTLSETIVRAVCKAAQGK
jgi:hypothetical protein